MEKIVMVSGQRTAFGAFGGSLKDVSATELATFAAQATLSKVQFNPKELDHVIIGNVVQSGADAAYLSRHVGLKIGAPVHVGAYNVNRLCGSGFQSWINAAEFILTGQGHAVLAGGVEQMSQIPYVNRKMRFDGLRMGNFEMEDSMTAALTDAYVQMPMAMTAEKLGEQYGITRADCDAYSHLTQSRYKKALDLKIFDSEISPITINTRKGEVVVNKDEHPKPEVAFEKIQSLKALFKANGLVTAATASGIVDGAAASLIMSESKAKSMGLKPLVEVVAWASVGCDPSIMGIGPAVAIRKALERAQLKLEQMDLIEVNEAFAAQYLAVEKELKLDREKTNLNGGAIAVGHPLGASGTRIMNHLALELVRKNLKYAVGSACIGGGQGVAIVLKKI